MKPSPEVSNTANAFFSVSSLFSSVILCAISTANSRKSMSPVPSASAASTISLSSDSVQFWPTEIIRSLSSEASMLPPPSLSNMLKASRNSSSCASVSLSMQEGS